MDVILCLLTVNMKLVALENELVFGVVSTDNVEIFLTPVLYQVNISS